ncbi:MAG: NAD(P)/FAD-dependent oxidoreductase, partial [Rhizomicrobium sp.]
SYGLEGGGIYALSRQLRDTIAAEGEALLQIDLRPELSVDELATRLAATKAGQSLTNRLRKGLKLSPMAINLMREGLVQAGAGAQLPADLQALAAAVKAIPIRLIAPTTLERAISTAGGIAKGELDDGLQLKALPGVYAAGEMLDWEAPTGGYLLTASFATGMAAARAMVERLKATP